MPVIDCHGHYTTAPKPLDEYRKRQIAALKDPGQAPARDMLKFSDDEMRASVQSQLKFQSERGTDVTIFSPRAAGMSHHIGTAAVSLDWSQVCNDLIHRVCTLYPNNFIGVCQLPQSPGVRPDNCIGELERCVKELGFVGCNLNPDPSGGYWTDPPLTDRWWYPIYEKLVELDVPAMVHVSASANPNFHHTGAHYINGDTTAFMQFLTSDLFKDFPTLRMIIPHGGGAAPYHWGRYRGLAQDMKRPPLEPLLRRHQALHRRGRLAERHGSAQDFRGQFPQGLSAGSRRRAPPGGRVIRRWRAEACRRPSSSCPWARSRIRSSRIRA
jgi:4-oxalmesaconate hydratase